MIAFSAILGGRKSHRSAPANDTGEASSAECPGAGDALREQLLFERAADRELAGDCDF
jgi:hypothetical protein